jgi:membrane fusion protein, multidrug efflux system
VPRPAPDRSFGRVPARCAALLLLLSSVACSGDDRGTQTAAAAPARGGNAAASGRGPGGPGGAGGPGGRGGAVTVLAASDVGEVRKVSIEAATPITGDLRPVETVEVRARLEGDLIGIYVNEGERVARGQLMARFESSEQESDRQSAAAELAAAQSSLNTAEWSAEQSAELFRAGAIAERDHKLAQQEVTTARAQVAAARARVRSTGSFVTDTRVLAPVAGIVERRVVQSGEHVARGAPMFTVVRNDVLELTASVPARLAGDVRAGQRVRFTADGRQFEGTVARVSPTIDPATRALTVYVRIPNANGALRGNTFATGRVVGRTIPDALVVPMPAVRQAQAGDSNFVYRIANGAVQRVPVRLGVTDEAAGVAQVLDGLAEGDRVVVGNVGTLGSGMKVQVLGTGEQGGAAR